MIINQIEKMRQELSELHDLVTRLANFPDDETDARLYHSMTRKLVVMAQNLEELGAADHRSAA
jgi:hypothetical protein